MFFRMILAAALALGLSAGAAAACECKAVVHHAPPPVVHHPAPCHCIVYHRVSYPHHHLAHIRVIDRTIVEHVHRWSDDSAYRYAEADDYRLRPSPLHPWDTGRDGYLTWSDRDQAYAHLEDRYSGSWRWDEGGEAWDGQGEWRSGAQGWSPQPPGACPQFCRAPPPYAPPANPYAPPAYGQSSPYQSSPYQSGRYQASPYQSSPYPSQQAYPAPYRP